LKQKLEKELLDRDMHFEKQKALEEFANVEKEA
jgi:hypothetical protein